MTDKPAPAPPVAWADYADGRVHTLRRGIDHEQEVRRARLTLIMWCTRHGWKLRSKVIDSDTWTVRITPRPGRDTKYPEHVSGSPIVPYNRRSQA